MEACVIGQSVASEVLVPRPPSSLAVGVIVGHEGEPRARSGRAVDLDVERDAIEEGSIRLSGPCWQEERALDRSWTGGCLDRLEGLTLRAPPQLGEAGPQLLRDGGGDRELENRFAQEDRELGLDRILSYHLPGQELATLVALALWNERVVGGFKLQPPADEPPLQGPRPLVEEPILPDGWPRDPILAPLLDGLDWDKLLANRSGWSYAQGGLVCDDGPAAHPHHRSVQIEQPLHHRRDLPASGGRMRGL